ncbi:AraC family transcriptional regulator [Bordetella pertussis]
MPAIAKDPSPRRAPAFPAPRQLSYLDLLTRQVQSAPGEMAALATDYPAGTVSSLHRHDRGQLLYAMSGVVTVITDLGSWVVAPGQALWIAPGVLHQTRGFESVAIRSLYIDPAHADGLPAACQTIQVSPLLQALILEAVKLPPQDAGSERAGHIRALILDEMRHVCAAPLYVPMPRDARLARICQALLRDDPANAGSLDAWAAYGGLSRRNLTRLFRAQTGASFNAWRQKVLLMEALARLSRGEQITAVALDLGYGSPGAFTAMFRRALGVSPREYFRWTEAPQRAD